MHLIWGTSCKDRQLIDTFIQQAALNLHVPAEKVATKSCDGITFSLYYDGKYFQDCHLIEEEGHLMVMYGHSGDDELLHAADKGVSRSGMVMRNFKAGWVPQGLFLAALYNRVERVITLSCDLSDIFPFYYLIHNGDLWFSSHWLPIKQVLGRQIDETGSLQMAALHFTIGRRTLIRGLNRVLAGEKVQVDIDSLNVQSSMAQSFYRGVQSFTSPVEAAESLWCEYAASNAALIRSNKKHGQCISGGFDTRLVALALKSKGGSAASVTFGEDGNTEVEIARCIARYMGSDHAVMVPKNEWVKDENWYERLFRSVESVNFPYMATAAAVLQAAGAQSITTGFGGETILGGQSFSVLGAEWDASARLKAGVCRSLGISSQLGRVLLRRDSSKAVSYIQKYVEKSIDRIAYILSDDVKSTIDYAKAESARDVQMLIGEYDYMDTTFGQILERFWFAHHVARHFGGQERTANLTLDVVLPIASRRFLLLCSVIRPDWKMDHGVYLKIVKQHFPKEFHLRTANIPIKLTNPELLLWMARAIRAKRDSFVSRSAIRNGELLAIKRDGWSNFESWVRSGSFLAWYPSAFSSGYFDRSAVANKIKRITEMREKIFSAQDLLTMLNVEYLTRL